MAKASSEFESVKSENIPLLLGRGELEPLEEYAVAPKTGARLSMG
jgi:hypothetical protein